VGDSGGVDAQKADAELGPNGGDGSGGIVIVGQDDGACNVAIFGRTT
jgi:hypothetical protein